MTETESRYETHDTELLAIVVAFRTWRHYLAYSRETILVKTDHNNLKYFMTKRKLNSRQARWAEELAMFDFVLEYRTGLSNPADAPSRRPDYKGSADDDDDDDDDEDACLPTLHMKLKTMQDPDEREFVVAVITRRYESPAMPQFKAQERGGRHSPTDQLSGSCPIVADHSWRRSSMGGKPLLEPVAGTAGCKQYVPRALAILAMGSETAFEVDNETLEELLARLQKSDPFVQSRQYERFPKSKKAGDSNAGWLEQNGLLRYRGAVYVPNDHAVKDELLRTNHDDPLGGHFGTGKTLEILRRKYFWQRMRSDVYAYVKTCAICQRTKVKRHREYGVLSSFPVPSKPWQEITMDFITDLPPSQFRGRVYDSILVVVDRYTKSARYIATTKTITAAELAELFMLHVFRSFGLPSGITSDRGSVFTSSFWSSLCFYLKIRRRLSTAFHPQTDGQTENLNQTLEQYLRAYCTYTQDDWAAKLALAEFTYNNSFHSTIGTTPFFALFGFHPTVDMAIGDTGLEGEALAATERVKIILEQRKALEERWVHAVEAQKKHYDKKHLPREFKIGDQVMLRAKNIHQLRPSKKLSDRYLGPLTVTEVVGHHRQAYRLELPKSYRIHDVFHVSLLEPYHRRAGAVETLPPIEVEGEEEFEVEAIVAHRETTKGRQYLVRWKGYAPVDDTWEGQANLQNAQEKLKAYHQRNPGALQERKRRKRK